MGAKNFRNGSLNPNAFRRQPLTEEQILESRILNYPLRQFMFCAPDEGAAAVIVCRADQAHRYTSTPMYLRADRGAHPPARRLRGPRHVGQLPGRRGPTVQASRAAFEPAGIGPEDVDVIQLQDTEAGAEVIHMAETGFCADGEQEKLIAEARPRSAGACPSTPTAA